MSNILEYSKNGGLMRIETSIQNTPSWSYVYIEDQTHDRSSNEVEKPMRHTLGEPHELIKPVHNWKFYLVNPSETDILVKVEVKWIQKNNDEDVVLKTWTKPVTVKAEDGETISGTVILLPVND